jgi:hypothetical protein
MKNIATGAELVLESGYICHLCPQTVVRRIIWQTRTKRDINSAAD